jgi:transposase
MYRSKSERIAPDQLALFLAQLPADEAAKARVETGGAGSEEPPASPGPKPESNSQKRSGRQPLPANLRIEVREVPIPPEDLVCSLGHDKKLLRVERQHVLEYKPAEFYLIEHQRRVMACKLCQGEVTIAPPAAKPIEGGRPGPGLLAHLVTSKFRDAVPVYRQSQILERSGIRLAPSTLGDWVAAAADLAEPLWKALRRDALSSYLLSLDDTTMPVLDRDHHRGIKRGHIWTFLGDGGRVGFCEYAPDWKGTWPQKTLAEFRGQVLQSDGYAGINILFEVPGAPRRAGCMDHCRRKWLEALEARDLRAAVPVALLRDVYHVERDARKAGADLDELHRRRQILSRPILERFRQVVADLTDKAPPKTPLGKAVTYAVNQWSTLVVFLDDPRVPLSNIHVEQQQRRTALGRKNYLFAGSDEGATRLAILQTLVINCELAKVPMFEYLRDVLDKLAGDWPAARIDELLPAAWRAQNGRQEEQSQAVAVTSATSA